MKIIYGSNGMTAAITYPLLKLIVGLFVLVPLIFIVKNFSTFRYPIWFMIGGYLIQSSLVFLLLYPIQTKITNGTKLNIKKIGPFYTREEHDIEDARFVGKGTDTFVPYIKNDQREIRLNAEFLKIIGRRPPKIKKTDLEGLAKFFDLELRFE